MSINEQLIRATADNNQNQVVKLLNNGANVDYINESGYAAIHGASISGFTGIVKTLIEHKADLNSKSDDSGFTALHFAAQEGHFDIVELLVTHGASINEIDNWGNGPLFRAGKNEEIGQYLIQKGADPKLENNHGISPLNAPAVAFDYVKKIFEVTESSENNKSILEATENENLELVKKMAAKVSLENKNEEGATPLLIAVDKENLAIAKILIENNAEIDSQDTYGYTPLSLACMGGDIEMVKLLLANGARTDIKLPFDNTLESLAEKHAEVLAYIRGK